MAAQCGKSSLASCGSFIARNSIREGREGDARRDFVASLYQTRGLSTDSSFDANFPVYLALKSLSDSRQSHLDHVLIVGPGLDFAPRSGLNDSIPPQSLQPYAVADALLQLGLSSSKNLRIDCVDINPRVVEYFENHQASRLTILSRPGTSEYERYFTGFGNEIGQVATAHGAKTIALITHDHRHDHRRTA